MTQCLICDFETRSELDLRVVGAWRYAAHPSTDVLCVGIGIDGLRTVFNPIELEAHNAFREAIDSGRIIISHNAMFEIAIYYHIMHKRYRYPYIPIDRWDCTMARGLLCGLPPALKKAAIALKLKEKKDPIGERLISYMCKPKKSGEFAWNPEMQENMETYCLQDVRVEEELNSRLPSMPEYERAVWVLDQTINMRGVKIDLYAVKAALSLLESQSSQFNERIKEVGKGYFTTANQRDKIIRWLKTHGIDTATLQKTDVARIIDETDNKLVKEVLTMRLSEMKTSNAKYSKMLQAIDPEDHRIRGMFRYHGAGTGRFSGAIVQLQNLPRKKVPDLEGAVQSLYDLDAEGLMEKTETKSISDACSAMLRSMIIPEDGTRFIVGDYASIEARGVMWLAGQDDVLRMFDNNVDIYKEMAALIYQVGSSRNVTPEQRQLGKTVVLGCGYGVGSAKFLATCKQMGLDVTEELAEKAVKSYRTRFNKVPELWYGLERAVKSAIKTGDAIHYSKVKIKQVNCNLLIKLPSSRVLVYRNMTNRDDSLVYESVKNGTLVKTDTYGSKLVENISQAICRDVLVEAMLRLDKKGYPIVMHVHDEIVAEAPKGFGSLQDFIDCMAQRPHWAANFPICVEGWEGYRYKK